MANAIAQTVPERSLLERAARVPSLLNQGVESMVAGTLALPVLVADGYIGLYRAARQAMGGKAYEESTMYGSAKAAIIDAGRTLDGSKGKVIQAETQTEKNIVFGTELVTGLVGPGAIKSLKTLSEGATFATAAKATATAAAPAATAAKAGISAEATAGTIGANVGKTAKTKLAGANEDALASLAKAKAAGEAERAGATVASKVAAEGTEAAAKTAVKETAEAAAKTVSKEAVESTSKKILGAAATAGSYAWTSAKVVTFPFRHPVLTLGGLSAGHLATDGWTSEKIWDGAIGGWNLTKEYAPAAADAVFEGSLKLGDGLMGFLATGGKKGAEGLRDHLPPGTPMAIREALGKVGAPKATAGNTPAVGAGAAAEIASAGQDTASEDHEDNDPFNSPQSGPFREVVGKFLNVDPSKVNGKLVSARMAELAKENPLFAMGMGIGTLYGATGAGKSPMERAMGGIAFGLAFGVLFQVIGQMYPGLAPGLMRAVSGAPETLGKAATSIGLKKEGVSSDFGQAANGQTVAPSYQPPASYTARTEMGTNFQQAAAAVPVERKDLNVGRPDAANEGPAAVTQDGQERVNLNRRPAGNDARYTLAANGM